MKKILLPIFCALFALTLSVGVVLAREDGSNDSSDGDSPISGSSGSSGSTNTSTPKPSTGPLKSAVVNTKNLRDATKQELETAKKKIELEREAAKKRFEQEREAAKDKFELEREEAKEKFEQERKDLKNKKFEKFLERIEKIIGNRSEALARLDLIASKIQSRIDKLKASGADVSAMQAALTACGSVKTAAAASIVDAGASVLSIDFNAPNAKELAQAQVSAIQQSNAALKSYHSCLTGVISQAPNSSGKGATGSAQ